MTGLLLGFWILFNDRGQTLLNQGDAIGAAADFRVAAALAEESLGTDHPATAMILRNLAIAYTAEGLYRKSEASAIRSLRILETRFGPADVALVPGLNALGAALAAQNRWTEARKVFERAVHLDDPGPHGATAVHNLAGAYLARGNNDTARTLYAVALERREAGLGADHPASILTRSALAKLQQARRQTKRKAGESFR